MKPVVECESIMLEMMTESMIKDDESKSPAAVSVITQNSSGSFNLWGIGFLAVAALCNVTFLHPVNSKSPQHKNIMQHSKKYMFSPKLVSQHAIFWTFCVSIISTFI